MGFLGVVFTQIRDDPRKKRFLSGLKPQVSSLLSMKVFGVGLITNAFQAETALQLEVCDVIDIGRAILSDSNWGWNAAKDLHETI